MAKNGGGGLKVTKGGMRVGKPARSAGGSGKVCSGGTARKAPNQGRSGGGLMHGSKKRAY